MILLHSGIQLKGFKVELFEDGIFQIELFEDGKETSAVEVDVACCRCAS